MRKEVSESAFEYLLAEMLNMAMPNMPEDEHVRNLLCIDPTYFLSCHIFICSMLYMIDFCRTNSKHFSSAWTDWDIKSDTGAALLICRMHDEVHCVITQTMSLQIH
jgi:hypothetical protein